MLDARPVVVLAEAVDLAVPEEGAHRLVRRELDAAAGVRHDDGPEAGTGHLPAAVDLGGVELDVPVAGEAEDVPVPVHDREHRVGVGRDVVDRGEAVGVLPRDAVADGLEVGGERAVAPAALDEAERHVVERRGDGEGAEVAVPLLVRLDLGEERGAAGLEKAPRGVDVADAEGEGGDAVGVDPQPAGRARVRAGRGGNEDADLAGAEDARLLAPLLDLLPGGAGDLGESEGLGVEAPAPLEVADDEMERVVADDAEFLAHETDSIQKGSAAAARRPEAGPRRRPWVGLRRIDVWTRT